MVEVGCSRINRQADQMVLARLDLGPVRPEELVDLVGVELEDVQVAQHQGTNKH